MDNRFGFNIAPTGGHRKPILFCIDSSAITTKNNYTVITPGYRDVLSIELIKAVIANPDADDYVILNIFGKDNIDGNTAPLSDAFCTLERSVGDNTHFIYKRENNDHNSAYAYYYDQPKKLRDLRITLTRPDGTVPDYGTMNNHFLMFEINTLNHPTLPVL